MLDNIFKEVVATTENEDFLTVDDDKQKEIETQYEKDERELAQYTLEAETFAIASDKAVRLSSIIDRAQEEGLSDAGMELLAESLSLGLDGVVLEKEGAPKTSENIKANFKKWIAKFVTFVEKVWTKFMNSFGATADKISKMQEKLKGVKKTQKLSVTPFIASIEIAGGGRNNVVQNLTKTGQALKKLYATKSVDGAVSQWNRLTGLGEGKSGLPQTKYVKGTVGVQTGRGKAYTYPKTTTTFGVFIVGFEKGKGKFVDRKTITLNSEVINKEAEGKTINGSAIASYLSTVKSKEQISKEIDEYYSYTKKVTEGDITNDEKVFYSDAVKYAFSVVNSEMSFNKGVYADAKAFLSASAKDEKKEQ